MSIPPLIFLSLMIGLFWIFHASGVIQHVAFRDRLLALGITFSGLAWIIMRIRTPFLFVAE